MFPDSDERTTAQNLCYNQSQTDPDPSLRKECYFDFAVTKDASLALSTTENLQAVAEEQVTLGKVSYFYRKCKLMTSL